MFKIKREPFHRPPTILGRKSMKKIRKVKTNIFWVGYTEHLDPKAQMVSLTNNLDALAGVGTWKMRFLTTGVCLRSNGSETNPTTGTFFLRQGILCLEQSITIDQIEAMFDKDDEAWACDCPYSFEEAYISLKKCVYDYELFGNSE